MSIEMLNDFDKTDLTWVLARLGVDPEEANAQIVIGNAVAIIVNRHMQNSAVHSSSVIEERLAAYIEALEDDYARESHYSMPGDGGRENRKVSLDSKSHIKRLKDILK